MFIRVFSFFKHALNPTNLSRIGGLAHAAAAFENSRYLCSNHFARQRAAMQIQCNIACPHCFIRVSPPFVWASGSSGQS